jgi:hypothetical protein
MVFKKFSLFMIGNLRHKSKNPMRIINKYFLKECV